jgi:hypothetical protein
MHSYFISIGNIDYKPKSNHLESSFEFTGHDIEAWTKEEIGIDLVLETIEKDSINYPKFKKLILNNIKFNPFKGSANSKIIGMEITADELFTVYIKTEFSKKIDSIGVTNDMLYSLYPSQQNIVHYLKNGTTETLVSTGKQQELIFKL